MPEYRCPKCELVFKKKWNYEYHIYRKVPCVADVEEKEEKEEDKNECFFCHKLYSNSFNLKKHLKICKLNKENEEEIKEKEKNVKPRRGDLNKRMNDIEVLKNIRREVIEELNIVDKTLVGMNTIIKMKNDIQPIIEDIKVEKEVPVQKSKIEEHITTERDEIRELKQEIQDLKNIVKESLTNHVTTTNQHISNHYTFLTQINQNIMINSFGKEYVDMLETDYYLNLLTTPYDSVPKLVNSIHFNKEKPSNMNIILPNKNLPFVYVFENGKWMIANKDNTLSHLVDINFERVDDFYEHYKKFLEGGIIENYERYTEEFANTGLKENIQNNVSDVLEKGSQQAIQSILEKRRLLQDSYLQSTVDDRVTNHLLLGLPK
jgi:hypothetical protein